jgi:hypothetical protein
MLPEEASEDSEDSVSVCDNFSQDSQEASLDSNSSQVGGRSNPLSALNLDSDSSADGNSDSNQ